MYTGRVVKQVFDIGHLFVHIRTIDVVYWGCSTRTVRGGASFIP